MQNLLLAVAFIPYWFRLMQCFRRYYETKLNANLKNAGKYFANICVQGAAIPMFMYKEKMIPEVFWTFVGINIFSTCYSYYWDLYMDWGFFRGTGKDPKFLRHKLLYPVCFYYFAAATNLMMRAMWILPLFRENYKYSAFAYNQCDITLLMLIEALRRTQWALIRIENENVNNFERYRNVLQIPEFKDMVNENK